MTSESIAIRKIIDEFIDERLQTKLEPLEKSLAKASGESEAEAIQTKIDALKEQYRRDVWLESAAKRVSQLQLVHFAPKFTHSSSKSSSRYLQEDDRKKQKGLVSTSTTRIPLEGDIVGNAAALDVFKFLSQPFGETTLLKLCIKRAPHLLLALSDSVEIATQWADAFATLVEEKLSIQSHQYAKQLFFPLDESEYHLLSPLYPSSLIHTFYESINNDRFSDESKAARAARKKSEFSSSEVREYIDLTVQKFGTTPNSRRNFSQLNSQRGGRAYLLASCPPTWTSKATRAPLRTASIFKRWLGWQKDLREQTKKLKEFLVGTDYNNLNIRNARARKVENICDEVLRLASTLQELPAGWTAHAECQLIDCEKFWLDPNRCEQDTAFLEARQASDWQSEIASRFAKWLNAQLKTDHNFFGDAEYKEWKTSLLREFRSLPLETYE